MAALITNQQRLLRDLEDIQIEVRFRNPSNLINQLNQVSIHLICISRLMWQNKKIPGWGCSQKMYKKGQSKTSPLKIMC